MPQCANPRCSETFELSPHGGQNKRYHSEPCAKRHRRALASGVDAPAETGTTPTLDQETLERLARLDLYEREWDDKLQWAVPTEGDEHRGTLVAFLSDTHFGEVVDPREMDFVNAYDLGIAEQRLRRYFERVAMLSRDYLAGVAYDGIVLALGGDLVSGDIHDELVETNEATTYETVEWAIPRLRAGIELLLEEFGDVHVVSAPGNHGRNAKVPRFKKRSGNNADTHIARLLAVTLAGEEHVTFDIPRGMDVEFDVYGYTFSMEHGDQAKGGDGQIGSIGPAKRLMLRKSFQTTAEGHPFSYLLLGHFHQYVPAASQGFVMNGSLKGYDEYARGWHFKPEPAQQALMVVTPEHGITVQMPVLVQKRSAEGW